MNVNNLIDYLGQMDGDLPVYLNEQAANDAGASDGEYVSLEAMFA